MLRMPTLAYNWANYLTQSLIVQQNVEYLVQPIDYCTGNERMVVRAHNSRQGAGC